MSLHHNEFSRLLRGELKGHHQCPYSAYRSSHFQGYPLFSGCQTARKLLLSKDLSVSAILWSPYCSVQPIWGLHHRTLLLQYRMAQQLQSRKAACIIHLLSSSGLHHRILIAYEWHPIGRRQRTVYPDSNRLQ